MAHGPTVAELLAAGKKKAKKIRKRAVKDVEALIPPVLGIGGRVAPTIATLAAITTEALINEVADRAFQDFQSTVIPLAPHSPVQEIVDITGQPTRVRSDKQLINDQIQSRALKSLNKKARKKDGSFKKGWNQKKVMRLAQRECTKERERLGLCKRKSTRKGQVRKTARRAYDSRLGLTRRSR